MPLSPSEKTIIATTITGHIDGFRIDTPADFSNLILALNSIITKTPPPPSVPEQMLEKIRAIQDYLDPDFVAVLPENRVEFLAFVRGIIGERIAAITRMTPEQQTAYIADQARHRADIAESRARMERQGPPRGEASTLVAPPRALVELVSDFNLNPPSIHGTEGEFFSENSIVDFRASLNILQASGLLNQRNCDILFIPPLSYYPRYVRDGLRVLEANSLLSQENFDAIYRSSHPVAITHGIAFFYEKHQFFNKEILDFLFKCPRTMYIEYYINSQYVPPRRI